MKKPNILYLHSHDTGRYVGPYGHAIDTPNLQRFAREGVLFRKAFCAAPTCSPSRAALLTGQAPHSCGMLGLVNRGFDLRDKAKLLPRVLGKAGYRTALCGVTHVARDAATLGYDQVYPTHGDPEPCESALRFLAGGPPQPFFLDVGFSATHRPFPEATAADARNVLPPAPLPDTPEVRRDMAGFHALARRLDDMMGKVLAGLEAAGLAKNTLVIVTTDHGIAFPRMKCNLTDHGMGVMLMLRGPGAAGGPAFEGGTAIDAMVSHLDLFPTICDVAGVERPAWLQGVSLLPLLEGSQNVRDEVFAEVNHHCAYEPMRAVRTERWKYIRRFLADPITLPSNCDPGPAKRELLAAGWGWKSQPREELYDLLFDPQESNNIAADTAMQGPLQEMRNRLDRWIRETHDPILQGPIPAPDPSQVNAPTDTEPQDLPAIKRPR